MKRIVMLILAASSYVLAQDTGRVFNIQTAGPGGGGVAFGVMEKSGPPVQGAPYSATVNNESVQTLADGNRIVHSITGATARDSQGRTRHDAPLPPIGNLSPGANAPHLVFIQDPVAQTSYTLNLTDKTAQKISMPKVSTAPAGAPKAGAEHLEDKIFIQMAPPPGSGGEAGMMTSPLPPPDIAMHKGFEADDHAQVTTEDLGSQTMEGVLVNGMRTTRTIAAGQIGNDRPISIVTEVWTSPELKTVISSKRSDPRIGEQTFELKNITRGEPDPSLFTVPADFKVVDGPRTVFYRTKQ
jgi:hypothetical protein